MRVVLPEPFGPSMPSTAPSGMSRSTSSTATVDAEYLAQPADPGGDGRARIRGDGERHRESASVSTCAGTAPAAMRPSSVTIADPTAVVISRPLPQVPLTGVPIVERSGALGPVVAGVVSAGLRMILTVSQPSPTVVLSGRCWRVASRARP